MRRMGGVEGENNEKVVHSKRREIGKAHGMPGSYDMTIVVLILHILLPSAILHANAT
jgi:hypothetical protein